MNYICLYLNDLFSQLNFGLVLACLEGQKQRTVDLRMESKRCLSPSPTYNVWSIAKIQNADSHLYLYPGKGKEMLILTRRIGEKLVVGDNVTVAILGVKGNQISVGIEAPREIKIHREEIFQKIQAQKNAPVALKRSKAPTPEKKDIPITKKRDTLVSKNRKKIIGI